jgi:hypothetical protein
MLVLEQLHDSGHVEITEVLVDRSLEHLPNRAYRRHRRISSCSFHGGSETRGGNHPVESIRQARPASARTQFPGPRTAAAGSVP